MKFALWGQSVSRMEAKIYARVLDKKVSEGMSILKKANPGKMRTRPLKSITPQAL